MLTRHESAVCTGNAAPFDRVEKAREPATMDA